MLEESEISEHCFDLIFAFDEIVALGYRENVNLAQIRTFTEMDSHEEKVFRAVREVRSHGCICLPVELFQQLKRSKRKLILGNICIINICLDFLNERNHIYFGAR